jgi:PAS domain S-box-containing protein
MVPDAATLSNILDALNVAVVATDENNNIVVFNRMAGEMLQEDPETRIGTSLLMCHAEQSEWGVLKMIRDMKTGESAGYDGPLNYRGRMMHEYISPLRDSQGNFAGMIMVIHDETEKVELLKRLGEWTVPHESGVGHRAPRTAVR